MSWEQEHEIPEPPAVIRRWRPAALHLYASKGTAELEQLKAVARADWCLNDIQERLLLRWLDTVRLLAQSVGGFEPEFGDQ